MGVARVAAVLVVAEMVGEEWAEEEMALVQTAAVEKVGVSKVARQAASAVAGRKAHCRPQTSGYAPCTCRCR